MPGSSDDWLNARAILKITEYLESQFKNPKLLKEAKELANRVDKPRGIKALIDKESTDD